MRTRLRRVSIIVLIAGMVTVSRPVRAQAPAPTAGQAAAILGTLAAVGVGGGFLLYHYVLRTPPTIKGCVTSGPSGLALQDQSPDSTVYKLTGDTAGIKAGDRVKLKGKRQKKTSATAQQEFFVEELKKDYGACRTKP